VARRVGEDEVAEIERLLMGHTPIPPYRPRKLTETEIEERRLDALREMVAHDEITYAQHGRYVEQVLRGQQPGEDGALPMMSDPELEHFVHA
jgi:hypothetical protein